jgi:hypothetical protein
MIDACDVSERLDPTVTEAEERAVDKRKGSPTSPRSDRRRIRSNAPRSKRREGAPKRNAINIEDRGAARRAIYADHSDGEGHQYRLADTLGARSLQFVHAMLNGLGNATADHSLDYDF